MKYLTDEILNKYMDNELSDEENQMVTKILKNSRIDKTKYTELIKINEALRKVKTANLSDGFTSNFMVKLRLKSVRDKKQKRFVIFISSVLVTLIVGFTGTAFYEAIGKSIGKVKDISPIKDFSLDTNFLTKNLESVFSPDKFSLIGISISLVIFISLYFLLEEIKKTKHRLNKIQ